MQKKDLEKKLISWTAELGQTDKKFLLARLAGLQSIYPFNEYEYRLMFLLAKKIISFSAYERLRNDYINANPYLSLYGIAPRIFGEIWAHKHLIDLSDKFEKPSKAIDKKFLGEYDLYVKTKTGIKKIEVKASRAINTKIRGGLETKALSFCSKEPFWMNFQQIKPDAADTFIFIGVWTDQILYWILSSLQIKRNSAFSHQHRGGIEFQIGITDKNLNQFKRFLVKPSEIIKRILSAKNNENH